MTPKTNPVTPLASPLGEEGHEVAKGAQANWIHRGAPRPANPVRRHPAKSVWTVVRMIMILLFYVLSPFAQAVADWRSGPRWSILSVLCPVHPFPLRGTSPQGETRDMERKTGRHILHVPFRCVPLWWLAPPPFPRKRGHYKTPLCCEPLMKELLFRALLSHHTVGGRWCRKAPKGGSHRRWLIDVMLFMTYDAER